MRSGREFSHVREVEILSDEEALVRLRGGPDDIVWLPDESLISDGVDVVTDGAEARHGGRGDVLVEFDLHATLISAGSVYGVARVAVGAAEDCPWRWPGQYEDRETGLYYNRFRYYDASRGNYIAQDPVRLLGGLALYGYVRDCTVNIDPFGLAPGGVDFADSPSLYPAADGQSSIVQIPLQGARGRDFTQANIAGGFDSTPNGYTWHHLDDFDPATGMSTMQLVDRDAHASVSHSGSVSQFEQEFGVKYGTPEARAISEENGWQRDGRRKQNGCGG